MDKATVEKFEIIVNQYRPIAEKLGISLQEFLLLTLSEQINDIAQVMIDQNQPGQFVEDQQHE